MVAAEQGNLEIAQELIRRGANVNLDDVVSVHTHTRAHNLSNGPTRTPLHTQVHVFNCSKAQVSTGTGEKQCGRLNHIIPVMEMTLQN